ncbi:MAG: response regulator [Zoogloeaceae bacterium]|jgi:DNA-binding NtrC family response regulator|nr:response regulator [Zoogloeaceae bacterium]
MADILIVDDEIGIRELLSEILMDEGHAVRVAENAAAARKARKARPPDLVLLDIWMPDTDGISLLKEWILEGLLTMPVVMMSGHGTIDTAVEATRIGAVDFLEKPIALQKLLATVEKALKHDHIGKRPPLTLEALAKSHLFRDLKRRLEQAAAKSSSLMLRGGMGVIAELCARTLHRPRAPWLEFADVTAPLTQETLQAHAGGLLYVRDLALLGKMQQMSLDFALERAARFNILVVAASSLSRTALAERGWDSRTLGRIYEVWLDLPEIVHHADDVPEIASLFLAIMVERQEVPRRQFSSAALNLLRAHVWGVEGNERNGWSELQTLVRNLALAALEEIISEADVRRLMPEPENKQEDKDLAQFPKLFALPLREARDVFEKLYFERLLQQEEGNMTRIAERSGLERTHIYRKLKQLGFALNRKDGGEPGAS